jgi:Fe-S cluster assembly protein SufD
MKQSYEFNIEKIKNLSLEEKNIRKKNLDLFFESGFPNKQIEDWKFTDLNSILNKNFEKIDNSHDLDLNKKIEVIKDFDHNYVLLSNGKLNSSNFKHEEKNKIKINDYNQKNLININRPNSLIFLNNALSSGGFSLEIAKDYKFKKPLIIYNSFSDNLKNIILNNKNSIKLNKGAELILLDYTSDNSGNNFINNTIEEVFLDERAIFTNISVQHCRSNGHFYKYTNGNLEGNSNYKNYIISSGLRLNKTEIEINLNKDKSSCSIQSALYLSLDEHQEIKTRINHNSPHCESYQKIKNVLNDNSKGVYQGKIFVKDVAQKTNAYQISRAMLLDDHAEFNAKPELEIYADDVRCSHGSTSGSIDEDSIHYLMTRGIPEKDAVKLLIKGFLSEVLDSIINIELKAFLENNLEKKINGH